MGFSFSQIDSELQSKRFNRHYADLRRECPLLKPFPDHSSLIAFFHASNGEYLTKDRILAFLADACRGEDQDSPTALLFLAMFRPAIAAIYKLTRKRWREIDDRDFLQEIGLGLQEILRESRLSPQRMAAQIVGRLKNRIRWLVNQRLRQTRLEVADGREERRSADSLDADWARSWPSLAHPRTGGGTQSIVGATGHSAAPGIGAMGLLKMCRMNRFIGLPILGKANPLTAGMRRISRSPMRRPSSMRSSARG